MRRSVYLRSALSRPHFTRERVAGLLNYHYRETIMPDGHYGQRITASWERPFALQQRNLIRFHVVENKVLTQIAKTLEHTVRNSDFVFRCGGDEFGVVLRISYEPSFAPVFRVMNNGIIS